MEGSKEDHKLGTCYHESLDKKGDIGSVSRPTSIP